MRFLTRELGIDLGTMNTVIAEGNQIVYQEPTVVAIVVEEQKMVEWGQAAKDMYGRVPESIEVVRPMTHGVIAEYEITENLLKFLIKNLLRSNQIGLLFTNSRAIIFLIFQTIIHNH